MARNYWTKRKPVSCFWDVMSGAPCITGTRIPIAVVQGRILAGETIQQLAEDYDLAVERIQKALEYAEEHYPFEEK